MNLPPGVRDQLKGLGNYVNVAAIMFLSLAAAAIFLWLMYDGRSATDAAGRIALLNTLLLTDLFAFVVSAAAALLCLYMSSLRFGDFRRAVPPEAFVVYGALALAPAAFILGDLVWKPSGLAPYELPIACGLSAIAVLAGVIFVAYAAIVTQPRGRVRALIGLVAEEYMRAGEAATAGAASAMRPPAGGPSLALYGLLKRLSTGDPEPVLTALDQMAHIALDAAEKAPDVKSMAVSAGMVAHVIEAGAIGAAAGSEAITCQAIERLQEIATRVEVGPIASAAFRGIGYTYAEGAKHGGRFGTGALDPWLAGVYAAVHDETGWREALDKAAAAADRALTARGALTVEERAQALFASGIVNRRLAEADHSEEKALLAISQLDEARAAGAALPLDAALVDVEIGQAYVALAATKNPIKSYRKALSLYEEAGKTLSPGVARYDAAALESRRGYASAMLADEYDRVRRHDDALDSARSAIAFYKSAAKYFTPERSAEEHGAIMSGAGLAHTLISKIYTQSREFTGALKHANMAIDCYAAALESTCRERAPESFASLKESVGVAQVSLAEIYFREKRYDEAIAACDSAIAAYNEALRTYDGAGKEKQAGPVRKRLKEANDLFNTFMMIGSGKTRQTELAEAV